MRLLACLIVAPQRGYDEPAILSYAISSFCPTSADGLQLCEYPGLSFQRSPVCDCSLVSSLLFSGATMSQQSSLTQSAHSVRQVLTAYSYNELVRSRPKLLEGISEACEAWFKNPGASEFERLVEVFKIARTHVVQK